MALIGVPSGALTSGTVSHCQPSDGCRMRLRLVQPLREKAGVSNTTQKSVARIRSK